jgi:uncharacterized membrane protein
VENRLNILSDPTQIPVFPGAVGANRIIRRFWKPAVRVLVGGSGAGLAWAGVRRGGLMGATMVAGGTALLAKAASKTGPGNLFDAARDEAIELRKTIIVEAPLSDVYRLWSAYENFPRFMSNVQEVRLIGGRRSHWVVGGPLSIPVEWDAVITTMEPMHVLAWKTLSGPAVQHAGVVNFEDSGDDTTRVSVHLTYRPAGGIVGQSVASLFHADPGRQMDEDLMRMKVFIETGVRPGAAGDAVPSTHLDLDAPVQEPVGARRRSRGDTGPDPEEIG